MCLEYLGDQKMAQLGKDHLQHGLVETQVSTSSYVILQLSLKEGFLLNNINNRGRFLGLLSHHI